MIRQILDLKTKLSCTWVNQFERALNENLPVMNYASKKICYRKYICVVLILYFIYGKVSGKNKFQQQKKHEKVEQILIVSSISSEHTLGKFSVRKAPKFQWIEFLKWNFEYLNANQLKCCSFDEIAIYLCRAIVILSGLISLSIEMISIGEDQSKAKQNAG